MVAVRYDELPNRENECRVQPGLRPAPRRDTAASSPLAPRANEGARVVSFLSARLSAARLVPRERATVENGPVAS